MKKSEFIKRFKLIKKEKDYFWAGKQYIERIVYQDECGHTFIFYNNDMCSVNRKAHHIGACYSWYH